MKREQIKPGVERRFRAELAEMSKVFGEPTRVGDNGWLLWELRFGDGITVYLSNRPLTMTDDGEVIEFVEDDGMM